MESRSVNESIPIPKTCSRRSEDRCFSPQVCRDVAIDVVVGVAFIVDEF